MRTTTIDRTESTDLHWAGTSTSIPTRKMDSMKTLLTYIAQHLVDNPEDVSINEISAGQTLVLELRVEKGDVGKVIGRDGRTAQALRTIMNAISGKDKRRAVLEIIEE